MISLHGLIGTNTGHKILERIGISGEIVIFHIRQNNKNLGFPDGTIYKNLIANGSGRSSQIKWTAMTIMNNNFFQGKTVPSCTLFYLFGDGIIPSIFPIMCPGGEKNQNTFSDPQMRTQHCQQIIQGNGPGCILNDHGNLFITDALIQSGLRFCQC